MKVFYHNDPDGQSSAFLIRKLINQGLQDRDMFECVYSRKFPIEKIQDDELVIILDFSISVEEMEALMKKTSKIWWIDHHATAIEKFKGFADEIKGIRRVGQSGCELTYEWCVKILENNGGPGIKTEPPLFIKLIGDYDTWTLKIPESKDFFFGCQGHNLDPLSEFWDKLYDEPKYTSRVIQEGKIIVGYRKHWGAGYMQDYGREVIFDGYKCFATNLGRSGSDLFGKDRLAKYDIVISYAQTSDGNKWAVSLYTEKTDRIDVGQVAAKHGGGGHKGAAGFTSTNDELMNLLK